LFFDSLGRVQPIEAGHPDVYDHDIGTELDGILNHGASVRNHPHHGIPFFQVGPQSLSENRVIVRD
jgi:hypothetical protein